MKKKIGFIGTGNMGGAIIGGIIASSMVDSEDIIASDINENSLNGLKAKYAIETTISNVDAAEKADILFLSVKPNILPQVVAEIKDCIKEDIIIVSIAAGQSINTIEGLFEKRIKLVRIMPNTPALVGEGMTAISSNDYVTKEEMEQVIKICNSFGKSEVIGEDLMDAVIGVSGSSPAYIYMFVEAMADAAVAEGLPRAQAYKFAAQTVLGSAKMILETGDHPGALKDMVCSPGGTTIEAVIELENRGLRSAVIQGVRSASKKSRMMGKQ